MLIDTRKKNHGYYTLQKLPKAVTVSCFIFTIRNIMKKGRKENAPVENDVKLVWEIAELLVNTVEGMSLVIAQLLEVTVLVSVACWCVKCKNESYSSGESCICQVYCLIKPIHLSTHWMPIKLHRMVQVYGGLMVPNFITAELFWLSTFLHSKMADISKPN